jgi:putative RNA 2'-phosphotransferase
VPPDFLFHGTAVNFVESIFATGLNKGNRLHVHLSLDEKTAVMVGKRHGKPVVLKVGAGDMHRAGFEFFRSANGVWLTDHVPADFILRVE